MANHNTLTELFTAIANSLRGKTGSSGKIIADDFPTVIDSLSTGGITPTGTKNITSNGTHDVISYASANVNVPIPSGYVKPSGTKNITSNGSHDVTNFATAQIEVPVGITPSGTKEITENGTFDVTNYASAKVNVPTGGSVENSVVRTLTLNALGGTATTINTLITGDAFIKSHYSHSGFLVTLVPQTPVASSTGAIVGITHGNAQLSTHSTRWTGYGAYWSSASVVGGYPIATNVNGTTYQAGFRVNSSGNLILYLPANRYLTAGTYTIILTCTD